LCLLAIAFISLFALDAFEPGLPLWKQITGFLIHLIPSFVLLALLVLAWKKEMFGGILFVAVGIAFTPWIFMHNYQMNNSVWMSLSIIALITLPFVVVGGLFIAHHRWRLHHPGDHA
jgi:thiol:disulfide interchange protein